MRMRRRMNRPPSPLWAMVLVAVAAAAGWWQHRSVAMEPLVGADAVAVLAPAQAPGPLRSVGVAYFYHKGDKLLEPVAFRLEEAVPPDLLAANAFDRLCEGPPPGLPDLVTAIPDGCRVEQVWLERDTLHVRFAPDSRVVPPQPGLMMDQLEMTAAQIPGVKRLELWAGPQRWQAGPLGVDGRPDYVKLRPRP